MGQELVFTVDHAKAVRAVPVSFADAGLRERDDLQEWVLAHPGILGDDVLVITSEYDGFEAADGAPSLSTSGSRQAATASPGTCGSPTVNSAAAIVDQMDICIDAAGETPSRSTLQPPKSLPSPCVAA